MHRTSLLAWALGGAVAMLAEALALAKEMADFPGGAHALAQSVMAGIEAMRPLRWPAERLDTLGGYLTYHNVMLFNVFLAIYGAVVGAKVLRGAEERHTSEEVLATGVSRGRLLAARTGGFVAIAAAVALGLSAGTALGMWGGGEPDLGGSLVTCFTSGLLALVGFGLGVLLGQVAREARTAAGLASLVLVVLYVATNLDGQVAGANLLAAVSPFTLANRSRALVPGHGLDGWATLVLLLVAALLIAVAAAAGERRDYDAPLWSRRAPAVDGQGHVARFMVGSVESSTLRRGAVGLAVWVVAAAAFTAMFGVLQPDITGAWAKAGFLSAFAGAGDAEPSYWTFTLSVLPAVLSGYAVTQASAWVTELQHGRVEMLRAAGVTWTRLVSGRLIALLAGSAVITVGAVAALAAAAVSVDSSLQAAGTARAVTTSLLFAAAMGSLAAVVTAVIRRAAAVTALGLVVGASYLVSYLVPLFGWPDWLNRMSLFWAFGTPYASWPSASRLVVLVVVAVGGWVLAALVADRSPAVP
ncbi:MAG: ABC transporter permease subunit [Angustibacter sp.]